METIQDLKAPKFTGGNELAHKFKNTVDSRVNEYLTIQQISKKGDGEIIVKAVIMLSLYIIPIILFNTVSLSLLSMICLFGLLILGKVGVGFNIMHDAAHGSFSNKPWVNKLLSKIIYFLGDYDLNWRIQHNFFHHTYTNIVGEDEDIEPRGSMRFSRYSPYKKIHKYQYLYGPFLYSLVTLMRFFGEIARLKHYKKIGLAERFKFNLTHECVKIYAVKICYLFLFIGLPIIVTSFLWWQVIAAFIVMHLMSSVLFVLIFQLAHVIEGAEQHGEPIDYTIEENSAVHQVKSTANFKTNKFFSWYIGGLNFQVEHHLFPRISHVRYKLIAPIVQKTVEEFEKKFGDKFIFTYNSKPSFLAAVKSHIVMLKELGINKSD